MTKMFFDPTFHKLLTECRDPRTDAKLKLSLRIHDNHPNWIKTDKMPSNMLDGTYINSPLSPFVTYVIEAFKLTASSWSCLTKPNL